MVCYAPHVECSDNRILRIERHAGERSNPQWRVARQERCVVLSKKRVSIDQNGTIWGVTIGYLLNGISRGLRGSLCVP